MNFQDIAAIAVILSTVAGAGIWLGSKMFATRADLHAVRTELQINTLETGLIKRDVQWIRAKLDGNGMPYE